MKDRQGTTAFYLEMLLLVLVFTGVVMMISGVFATAKEQSSKAVALTNAVRLAQNAAEIVAGTDDRNEMVDLLGDNDSAACHLEAKRLIARYNGALDPDPDGDFLVEITWEDKEGLVSYDIRVTWNDGEPVYELKTSVFYE